MDIKPFHFKLKKVSAREQRVLEALFEFLPKTGMRGEFHDAIREVLSRHLGADVSYQLEAVTQQNFDSFCDKLADQAVIAVLGMAPREGKIIVDIDCHLASLFIEKLLGGTGETIPSPKPLSDTEQGVLQYLFLQVLAHLYRLCGQDARLHFRFEKFAFCSKGIRGIIEPDESISVLNIKFTVGNHDGFLRILFPSPLIEQLYLKVEAKGEARAAEREYILDRLGELGYVNVPLWAEVGSTTVTAGDMRNLEVGDVVVFDRTEVSLIDTGPIGRAILRAGEGRRGGFITELKVDPKKVHCRIVDVRKGEDLL